MKTDFLKYIFLAAFAVTFFSCEEKVEKPSITRFEVNPSTAPVGVYVTFTYDYDGTYAVIWNGGEGSNYDAYLEQIATIPDDVTRNVVNTHDRGTVVRGTSVQAMYRTPGNYKALLIVTNVGNMGETSEKAMKEVEVTITE